MDAKLISEIEFGVQLRFANRKSDTWPGYPKTCPLGYRGYWVGTYRSYRYIGPSLYDVSVPEMPNFDRIKDITE